MKHEWKKHEWKKHEKDLYLPKNTPMLMTVPMQKFFAIKGKVIQTNPILPKK